MANTPPAAAKKNYETIQDAGPLAITLTATDADPGDLIKSFSIATLPTNGLLYLDAALTNPVLAGVNYEALSGALNLFFVPATHFVGDVSFDYSATSGNSSTSPDGSAGATTFYLTINGLNGGSTAKGHEGAFEISDFKFDVASLAALAGGGGASADKADFDPLTVDLALGSSLTSLLADVATGKHIGSVRLEGVNRTGKTLYDLRLGDVTVAELVDQQTGLDQISFDYAKMSLTTTAQDIKGGLGPSTTFAFDLQSGKTSTSQVDAAKVAGKADGSAGATDFFLTIDGLNGGSVIKGHEGAFKINDFKFNVANLAALAGGGAAAGKADFDPLTVNLAAGGLTSLLADVASGKHIGSVRLEGVSRTGKTLYDLRLGDVTVAEVLDQGTGLDTLSFDYAKMSLTTTAQDIKGGLGPSTTFAFDLGTVSPSTEALAAAKAGGKADGAGATTFYLTIDGLNGGSTSKDHKGAFEISNFKFDVLNLAALAGGGAATGKADFDPLTVDLTLGSGLARLLADVATGKHIDNVRLEGVNRTGKTIYDLRLGDVIVSDVLDQGTGPDALAFDYGKMSLTTTPQDIKGALGAATTFAFDLTTGVASDTQLKAAKVDGTADGSGGATTFYLTIDGLNGGSTSKDHKGAFAISNFKFDVSNLAALAGGGAAAGKADFDPLTVDLALGGSLTSLLADVATGDHIGSVRLEGVNRTGKTLYDLRLGDVTVAELVDQGTGLDQLSFDYGKMSLTTTAQDIKGALGPATTFAFDLGTVSSSTEALPIAKVGGPADGAGATTFYLTIDGLNGGSTSKDHKGAFEISDFKFDVANLAALAGGGAATGKADFDPLTVDLTLGSGLTSLLTAVATGKHIGSVRLEGVNRTGKTIYDLRLGDVTVADVLDQGTGPDALAFDYSKISLTTTAQDAKGALGAETTFGFDLKTLTASTSQVAAAKVDGTADGAGGATTFYLTIDGLNGGSVIKGHEGAFAISDFKFNVANLAALAGGGAAAGEADFDPLTVDLALGSGLTSLLRDVATGNHISKVRLEGVNGVGKTLYDLRLADVAVSEVFDQGTGLDTLSFDYSKISLTTTAQDPKGKLGNPTTFGFDLRTNTTSNAPLAAAVAGSDLVSDPANVSITVTPATPPVVSMALAQDTGASATDLLTNNATLTGLGDPNATVHFLIDNVATEATATADSKGVWSFTPALADGPHIIVASETNGAELTGSASLAFTLDTAPPPIGVFLSNDSGASVNDGVTSSPNLTGSSAPNALVTIYEGAAALGETAADATGKWSFAPFGLADGPHVLTARESDLAGNIGVATLTFLLDTSALAVTARLANDTGASNEDGVTKDPTLTGAGEAGATITLKLGESVLGATVVDADGAWTLTPVGLDDGETTVDVVQTDAAGNVSTASVGFTLYTFALLTAQLANDTGAPDDGLTRDPTLAGTGEADAEITIVEGDFTLGATTANADGFWSFTPVGLADGDHNITVLETDLAGNEASASVGFHLDATPPALSIALASDTGVSETDLITSNPALWGLGEPGADIVLMDGESVFGVTQTDISGAWSFAPEGLADRDYAIVAHETDLAGNESTASLTFTLDTQPPDVSVRLANDTGEPGDAVTSDPTLTVFGEEGALIEVRDGDFVIGQTTIDKFGVWTFTPDKLSDGAHTIGVRAQDAAGNVSLTSLDFMLDTLAPDVSIALANDTGEPDGLTGDPSLTGFGEPGGLVTITEEGGGWLAAALTDDGGKWSAYPDGVAPGPHKLVASQTDLAGNIGAATLSFTYEIPS